MPVLILMTRSRYVTWDNIDLNRNGVFDAASCLDSAGNLDSSCSAAISGWGSSNPNRASCENALANSNGANCVWTGPDYRSGDCVPSGTRITPGTNNIQGTGPAVSFNPYERDHDGDGTADVAVSGSEKLPADGRPPHSRLHPTTQQRLHGTESHQCAKQPQQATQPRPASIPRVPPVQRVTLPMPTKQPV
jgi:hypothetical protein